MARTRFFLSVVQGAVLAQSQEPAGATYELVSSGRYTAHELASVISEVTGREVTAEQIDAEVFLRAALGVTSLDRFRYQSRVLRAISKRYGSYDFIGNPKVLTWLLGRSPTTFEQFVPREFSAFQGSARF